MGAALSDSHDSEKLGGFANLDEEVTLPCS